MSHARPDPARRAALTLLSGVLDARRTLAQLAAPCELSPSDAARAQRLALTVLRHLGRLDALIRPLVRRRPARRVEDLLRMGAAELMVDGSPPHGVVDACVTLAKADVATRKAAGLVNAVLRKLPERAALWPKLPPQTMPVWLMAAMKRDWPAAAMRAMEAAHERGAPLDLTLRGATPEGLEGTRLPTGSLRVAAAQVSALPGYAEGAFWVQDAGAALPVRLLDPQPGERVLDLCAAPGGKTLQLAAAGADVTALDISPARMAVVHENLARTGLTARAVIADALDYDAPAFDAVLVDAPCSATGTIRRHPDLPFVKGAVDAEALTRLQARLIDRARGLLAPGGRMVFCTCSILKNEGERQVTAALKRHPDLAVIPADPASLGGDAEWASPEGGLRLRPDHWAARGGIDGFYMACLQRR